MFGEESIPRKADAYDQLVKRREEQAKIRQEMEAGQDDQPGDSTVDS
jgi:hypothetical protein